MKAFRDLIKLEGVSQCVFSMFRAQPGQPLPDGPGLFVFLGKIQAHGSIPQELSRCFAGHTLHLDQAWRLLPGAISKAPWIHWSIAYLEVDDAQHREAWAADLQAGLTLRNRAA